MDAGPAVLDAAVDAGLTFRRIVAAGAIDSTPLASPIAANGQLTSPFAGGSPNLTVLPTSPDNYAAASPSEYSFIPPQEFNPAQRFDPVLFEGAR